MKWEYNDGGRKAAGYIGSTGDCVCRAIAISTGLPYQKVYEDLIGLAGDERITRGRRVTGRSHPRTGIYKATIRRYMEKLGWIWKPTMGIGTGCKVHLKNGELPMGRLLVSVSKHMCAVVDGVVHDRYDPSRNGTRCVYGYWKGLTI